MSQPASQTSLREETPLGDVDSAPQRRATLLVAYDYQYKWARQIGRALERQDVGVTYVICSDFRHSISDAQIGEVAPHEVPVLRDRDELLDDLLDSDIVVFGIQGPLTSNLTAELVQHAQRAGRDLPVTVTGWVGVIIEKIVAGYLERFTSDVVAVNSRADLAHVRSHSEQPRPADRQSSARGLPLLSAHRLPLRENPIKTVMFADQPTVPKTLAERTYLYQRLADYARAHPDRRVILKPRHRPDEDTFHRMSKHPEILLEGMELPSNLEVDYTPVSDMLNEIDLMLTVSSTAALEALGHGIRTAFVLDLGIHERLGNQIFTDSGLLRTFDQLIADDVGEPAEGFVDDYFLEKTAAPVDLIAERASELVGVPAADRPSRSAIDTDYFAGVIAVRAFREDQRRGGAASGLKAGVQKANKQIRVQFDNSLRSRAKALALVVLPVSWLDRTRRKVWNAKRSQHPTGQTKQASAARFSSTDKPTN